MIVITDRPQTVSEPRQTLAATAPSPAYPDPTTNPGIVPPWLQQTAYSRQVYILPPWLERLAAVAYQVATPAQRAGIEGGRTQAKTSDTPARPAA